MVLSDATASSITARFKTSNLSDSKSQGLCYEINIGPACFQECNGNFMNMVLGEAQDSLSSRKCIKFKNTVAFVRVLSFGNMI